MERLVLNGDVKKTSIDHVSNALDLSRISGTTVSINVPVNGNKNFFSVIKADPWSNLEGEVERNEGTGTVEGKESTVVPEKAMSMFVDSAREKGIGVDLNG